MISNQSIGPAAVSHAGEGGGQEGEVVDLLQGDEVGPVQQDLLQHAPPAAGPVKHARVLEPEVVKLRPDRCNHESFTSAGGYVIDIFHLVLKYSIEKLLFFHGLFPNLKIN